MSRNGWFGMLPFLDRWTTEPEEDQVQGLVLAGGGSRASFQIGALRYLYTHADIAPTSIVGTSAGAIVGAVLAQSREPEEQHAALCAIEKLWLGMQNQADMFIERDWFSTLQMHSAHWAKIIDKDVEETPRSTSNPLSKLSLPFISAESSCAEELILDPEEAEDPQAVTLALAMQETRAVPLEWTPSLVLQLANALPRLGRIGPELAQALREAGVSGSMYLPGKILTHLLSRQMFDSSKVRDSGMQLRVATVGLRHGELRFMREDGYLVDRYDVTVSTTPFELSMGILASCSIPGVFRPVPLGDELYVDGGVRENVPVELAVASLGVTKPYVVTCHPSGVSSQPELKAHDLVSTIMRSVQIMMDEAERDEVAYARASGAVVIDPEFEVHDLMDVEPGLMQINRDYGWLRAAEEHLNATPEQSQLHRDVIQARVRAWEREKILIDNENASDADMTSLSEIKYSIRDLLRQIDPRMLPTHSELWWQNFERHVSSE